MKQFYKVVTSLLTATSFLLLPASASFAANLSSPITSPLSHPVSDTLHLYDSSTTDLFEQVKKSHYMLIGFGGLIAIACFIFYVYKSISAAGDTQKSKRAEKGMFFSFIGLSIAMIGYLTMNIVFDLLGITKNNPCISRTEIQTGGGGWASGSCVDMGGGGEASGSSIDLGGGGNASGSDPISSPIKEDDLGGGGNASGGRSNGAEL